jgi:hypothetical protein
MTKSASDRRDVSTISLDVDGPPLDGGPTDGPGRQDPWEFHTGCGAAWLARLTGGQEVGSSNLPSPTVFHLLRAGGALSVITE